MTILLMTSAKVFLSTPLSEWGDIITKDTVLITEKNHETEKISKEASAIFKDILLSNFYYDNEKFIFFIIEKHKDYQFEKIIALSEGDLLRAAYLRKLLNILGELESELVFFRDKTKMKHLASCHGIRTAKYAILPDKECAFNLLKKTSFPLILKPIDGRGSADTFKISSKEELMLGLKKINTFPFLVEEYVEGDMYHIDGIVVDGKVTLCSPAKYINNCLEFVEGKDLGSYILMPTNPLRETLVKFSNYLLEYVFPTPNLSLFHIEAFVDSEQHITLCEIAARMGGNSINKEISLAYGFDIKRCYLDLCYENPTNIKNERLPYRCAGRYLIPPKNGSLKKNPSPYQDSFVVDHKLNLQRSNRYQKMKMSNNELASFLLISDNEKEMLENFEKIRHWKENEILWNTLA